MRLYLGLLLLICLAWEINAQGRLKVATIPVRLDHFMSVTLGII